MPSTVDSSFFDKLFNPCSIGRTNDDLVHTTKLEFCVYLLACTIIGAFTLGMPHIFHEAYHHYQKRKITESNPTGVKLLLNPKTEEPAQQKPTDPPNHVTFNVVKKTKEEEAPKPNKPIVPLLPLHEIPSSPTESIPARDSSPVPKGSPTNPGTPPSSTILGAARPMLEEKVEVNELPKSIQCEHSQGKFTLIKQALGKQDVQIPGNAMPFEHEFSRSMIEEMGPEGLAQVAGDQENNKGSQACALICLKAVFSFFNKGTPKTDKDIYELIYEGITEFIHKNLQEQQVFIELFKQLSPEETKDIEVLYPDFEDKDALGGITEDMFVELVIQQEYHGEANHLPSFMEVIAKRAIENKGRSCAVLTTQPHSDRGTNATLVIMVDEDKQLWLFDSHGACGMGASLKSFKDSKELSQYVQREFFKNENGQISIKVLNKQLA